MGRISKHRARSIRCIVVHCNNEKFHPTQEVVLVTGALDKLTDGASELSLAALGGGLEDRREPIALSRIH